MWKEILFNIDNCRMALNDVYKGDLNLHPSL